MNERIMLFDYDYENDILFLHLAKDYNYDFSELIDKSVVMDLNEYNMPIGFEITDASTVFKSKKFLLNNINQGTINLMISEKDIELKIDLVIEIHNKANSIPMNIVGDNNLNIPNFTTEIAIDSA